MGRALLFITVGFSTIFGGIMFNLTSNQQRSSQAVLEQYQDWLRRNAMETAQNVAAAQLYQNPNLTAGFTRTFSDVTLQVSFTDVTGDSAAEAKTIQVTTVATYGGGSDTTVALYIQPAYSYYYDFLRTWSVGKPRFSTGETYVGPIHVNDPIQTDGTPVFMAKVSSDASTIDSTNGTPKFYHDTELGTATIPLDVSIIAALSDTIQTIGDVYGEELWLTLQGTAVRCSTTSILITKNLSDFNGLIMTTPASDLHIHVKGTLDGRLTVLSDRDIKIEDNVVYADASTASNDFLGLIAKNKVVIVDNGNSINNVHAAIMAINGKFEVQRHLTIPDRGVLNVLGSIIQSSWRATGAPGHGYVLNHIYDPRLRRETPPYFPRLADRIERVFRSD